MQSQIEETYSQYAILVLDKENKSGALLDIAEDHILSVDPSDIIESGKDKSQFIHKLVYGRYMVQRDFSFPRSEIKRHINDAVDSWLAHISQDTVIYLSIEDIEIIDVVLTSMCSHCPEPHKTADIPFAALISCPPDFKLNNEGFAKTAFLRWHDMDIHTNLLNRMGLFAFTYEENDPQSPFTKENWKHDIDYDKATEKALKVR
ncbi:hypothetical protein [Aliivibrio fischeri]|uniref:hypothetical protein n=1 Tax=Aliivibrio fischeri TaxID=668 RepID=UPI0007C50EBB|nr:hypothetical protein [Aliivibrio fischeri]